MGVIRNGILNSRVLAEDLIQPVFDDDFELDDDEDSNDDGTDNIYGYIGDPILWRADLMMVALGEAEDDCKRTELLAASLGTVNEGEHSGPRSNKLVIVPGHGGRGQGGHEGGGRAPPTATGPTSLDTVTNNWQKQEPSSYSYTYKNTWFYPSISTRWIFTPEV